MSVGHVRDLVAKLAKHIIMHILSTAESRRLRSNCVHVTHTAKVTMVTVIDLPKLVRPIVRGGKSLSLESDQWVVKKFAHLSEIDRYLVADLRHGMHVMALASLCRCTPELKGMSEY